jgi:hypothetical protein
LVLHTDGTRIPQKATLENPLDLLRSILFRLKTGFLNNEIERLLKAIQSPDMAEEQRTGLQRAHADLIMQKRRPVEIQLPGP